MGHNVSLPYAKWYATGLSIKINEVQFYATTDRSGSVRPHYRGFTITLRYTTLGRIPLDEWSAQIVHTFTYCTTKIYFNIIPIRKSEWFFSLGFLAKTQHAFIFSHMNAMRHIHLILVLLLHQQHLASSKATKAIFTQVPPSHWFVHTNITFRTLPAVKCRQIIVQTDPLVQKKQLCMTGRSFK